MEMSYYEKVVEPTFPILARKHNTALFDVLFSLRVAPEPHLDGPEDPGSENAQDFAFRQQHQAEWTTHVEDAFLVALTLRSTLQKSTYRFNFDMVRLGRKFDPVYMVPMVKPNLQTTQRHSVLLCLSPIVTSFVRGEHPSSERVNVRAKVAIDGFEVNKMAAEKRSVSKDNL